MKKTKNILALVLALMMALSAMTMPAMAHGHDDEVSPQMAWVVCPVCGGAAQQITRQDPNNSTKIQHKIICQNCPGIDWT